jgi:hypothetical protein
MYSKKTQKSLRAQFNAYATGSDDGHAGWMFYTNTQVVTIKRGTTPLYMHIKGYDEDLRAPRAQTDTSPFESDPLWTPERTARKATAKNLATFIAQAQKREKTRSKKQDSSPQRRTIRIVLG